MELSATLNLPADAGAVPVTFGEFGGRRPDFDPFALPYPTVLSLDQGLRRVAERAGGGDAGAVLLAGAVNAYLDDHPELRGPQGDPAALGAHTPLLELLTAFLIPVAERSAALYKFSEPFRMDPLYVSPSLRELMRAHTACYSFDQPAEAVRAAHIVTAGCLILRQCYGVDVTPTHSAMLTFPCPQSTVNRYFRPVVHDDYVEVVVTGGELPPLAQADIHRLLRSIHDTELWLRLLPPGRFAFHGFHFSRMHEVTREESLSRLKHRLISRDAVLDVERVRELADLIRIHFQRPDFEIGVAAVDYPRDRAVDHEYRIAFNFLQGKVGDLTAPRFAGSVYDRAFRSREAVLVEDLADLPEPTKLETRLLKRGLRSILITPLRDKERNVIGVLELGSAEPYAVNAFVQERFEEIRALFRTAVARSREYVDNRIEAILREQYTSLHESVEWRFVRAAFNYLQQQEGGENPVAEPIAFRQVFPLYGQADIVGSSSIRNTAILQDMLDNLRAGRHFLTVANKLVRFPLIEQVILKLDALLSVTPEDFDNSREVQLTEFIHGQLTPLVAQLGRQHPDLAALAEPYAAATDNELGLFYRVRRDYEQSVSRLNTVLSEFFTERDQASQAVLPHYFEKYKTDGLEYEIYVGQSLLKQHTFSEFHLRNLRLSQLVDMCDATRLVGRLSAELPMPLRTAQLIFAYSTPLDIRFRMDEKRFDVDGDYNVRYEILKKRIDKATVRGGQERLTQAGTVSIVYFQDREQQEYLDYLHYLHQTGYVNGEVERFTLDPLQSVSGLRALRFRVRE